MSQPARQEFLFGEYATDERLLARMRAARQGINHQHRITPLRPQAGTPVSVHVTVGPEVGAERLFVLYRTDGEPVATSPFDIQHGECVEARLERCEWDTALWGYVRHYRAELPGFPTGTRVAYLVCGWSEQDPQCHFADSVDRYQRPTLFVYHVGRTPPPMWLRDAIFYHIFIDRFHPGPDRTFAHGRALDEVWGGTLAGIRHKLPYLHALGINALWLSPCYRSDSPHGYDIQDFRAINPRQGTLEELRALVAEAHALGLRVILDFVANHAASSNPLFQAALAAPDSPERDWFFFDEWPERYQAFFDLPTLPKLNPLHPPARNYLIESALYWLEAVGADGFRLDHAHGVATAFWSDFGAALRARFPDAVAIAEVTESADFLSQYEGRLDGVLDFIWHHQMRRFFLFDLISAPTFEQFIQQHEHYFGPMAMARPTFLDNHDMNRFAWLADGDTRRLKLAALCQFTHSQPPILYYGTEVGVSQTRDVQQGNLAILEESRQPMRWGEEQDVELLAFYRRLIHFRRQHPACYRGRRIPLVSTPEGGLAYARQHDGEVVITALNNGDTALTMRLPLARLAACGAWQSLDGGRVREQEEVLLLRLQPRSGTLLYSFVSPSK